MSFAEWTATSIRSSRSASSISFTKTPREPISPKGRERSRSPAVVIGTSATWTPGRRLGFGELGRPDPLRPPRKRRDRRHALERGLPLTESLRLGRDDRLGPLRLAPPAGERLRDDRLEVVEVVEVAAVEVGDLGIEVARNGEVDEEDRPAAPAAQGRFDVVPPQDVARSARRGDDDVGGRELLADAPARKRLAPEPPGQRGRPVGGAIRDEGDPRPARDEVPGRELAHLARAEEHDRSAAELAEDLLGERGAGRRDRGRTLADRGLRPRLAAGVGGRGGVVGGGERGAGAPQNPAGGGFQRPLLPQVEGGQRGGEREP